jgi:hypothetical protein
MAKENTNRTSALLSLCCLASILAQPACSKKMPTATGEPAMPAVRPFHDLRDLPGTIFEVTYTPATVRIEESAVHRTLKSIGSAADIYVFDDSDERIRGLHEGQVLFLENLAVRKVIAVARHGNQIVVGTDYADLTEFIQKGHLQWRAPIRFGSLLAGAPPPATPQASPWKLWLFPDGTVYASSSALSYSGKVADWDVSASVTPTSNRMDMSFKVHRNIDDLGAMLSAKGYLRDFFSNADIQVSEGSVDNFNYAATSLNGEMNVEFAATRDGDQIKIDEPNVKLPPLAKIPMPIGGIPFLLTISANLIVKPGFGAKKEGASGSFKVTYDGEEGIQVHSGNAQASGTVSGDGTIGNVVSTSLAPHGMVVGMAAPKIALSLGLESALDVATAALPSSVADSLSDFLSTSTAGQWVKKKVDKSFKTEASASVQTVSVFTLAAAGSLAMVPCKFTHVILEYKAGADGYLLGKKVGDKEVMLLKKDIILREPDINMCGEK